VFIIYLYDNSGHWKKTETVLMNHNACDQNCKVSLVCCLFGWHHLWMLCKFFLY